MGVITITNLNDGINIKADPSAISEGGLADCVGFSLTEDGVLKTAGGVAVNDIPTLLPSGAIQCKQTCYIQSTRYVLATTSIGLYANGVLVYSGFVGRFKAVGFLDNIYLVNGVLAIRFDGTTAYKWGITAPSGVPTIAPADYLYKTIDTFEVLTTWTANQVDCVVAAEATIKKEGTQSAKFSVAVDTLGYSHRDITVDGSKFSTGEASTNKDYFRFWLYVDNLVNLDALNLIIDVGDKTFLTDYFSYSVVSPGLNNGLQTLGLGKTADVIAQDTTEIPAVPPGPPVSPFEGSTDYRIDPLSGMLIYDPNANTNATTIITKTITKTVIDPIVSDQALAFWRRSNLFQLKSATWQEVKIPKSVFIQSGDMSKGWDTIASVKIEVKSTALGAVVVYIDDMKFVGGSDLVGDYWFMYSYARIDGGGNVLHESAPSRNATTKLVNIVGPVTFDREPLTYSARPLSTDPQVNAGLISALGGGLTEFWELILIEDNTTQADTLTDITDQFAGRILVSKSSEPAPPGIDLLVHKNKIWMIGDPTYPRLLRSSDILADGTFAPEAWPTRNAYDVEDNQGALLNIRLVNKQPVIKGESGEWLLQVLDPTDSLQVKASKVSPMGVLGMDSVVDFETTNVYPSLRGFVESDGNQARFVMPEVQPLIDSNISSAIGVNAGLISYFTYRTNALGDRTAEIDLFRGKPRFSNINNIFFDWLEYDPKTDIVYAIKDGAVYILGSGSTNEAAPGKELLAYLKSRVYRPGGCISWSRMSIIHDTGGMWYRLEVYVDGRFICSMPFKSTSRTETHFRDFGPISGYDFQFVITGNYTTPGTIYFPIRIFHGGQ